MLHIVNGESTAALLRRTAIAGELLSWADILVEGPTPNRLAAWADWQERAAYLDDHLHIESARYLEGMRRCLDALEGASAHDEIVLWFEEDLFCQTHLAFILARLAERDPGAARLTLMCPEEPLGTMSPEALATLFGQRTPVTAARIELATRFWEAYVTPDPRRMEALLSAGFSAWPLLRRGVLCHLERLPSTANGLNTIEEACLSSLVQGPRRFSDLFRTVSRRPRVAPHGVGDMQIAVYLEDLSAGPRPLITVEEDEPETRKDRPAEEFAYWRVAAAAGASDVLAGRVDRVALLGLDRRLGGIALSGTSVPWRWDGEAERVVAAAGAM